MIERALAVVCILTLAIYGAVTVATGFNGLDRAISATLSGKIITALNSGSGRYWEQKGE